MEGDEKGGFTIFYADDGLDTGPILLQKSVDIDPNETVDSLYNRFLYPEGIKGMVCTFYSIIYIVMGLNHPIIGIEQTTTEHINQKKHILHKSGTATLQS